MRYTDDSLAGLEEDRRGSLPRGGRRWTGSLRQRARAARGLPQAVFKISSYSHSAGAVWDRVKYVSREGEIEAEGPNGELRDQEQLERTVEDWNRETAPRARRQYAMSAVVSFPQGVDEEKATEAARQFFRAAFADNHDYVFAAHTDAKQFHVHVVVQSAGHDGKQLRIRRDDLQDLRMLLAEKAAAQGIELDASPRWARGLDAERPASREAEGIRRRGETPRRAAGEQAGQERTDGPENGGPERARGAEGRGESAGAARPCQALEYARSAAEVAGRINKLTNDQDRVAAVKEATGLARFGWDMAQKDKGTAEEREQARAIIDRAERALRFAINRIEKPQGKREAIQARQTLYNAGVKEYRAAKRAAERQRRQEAERETERPRGQAAGRVAGEQAGQERTDGPENGGPERARGAEGRGESAGAARPCQALEYARSAAEVAGRINKLTNDQDRVAAVKEATGLARFGWDMAQKDKGTAEEREQARAIIDRAERALRFAVNRIEKPQGKREAIQARQTLYNAGVKEYRAAKRETERQRRQEAERDDSWER